MTRFRKRLMAFLASVLAMFTITPMAFADMQGIDVSNWQCGIDIANTQSDFVVVGTTWGTGQVNNSCLVSGVNTDANRMIAQAQASGKRFGLYHYAMGGSPEGEAQFFYRNTSNYWRHGIVALDWEMDDNPAWGNWDWVRRFMAECERLSGGVRPLLYTAPVAGTIPQDIRDRYGLWIAQYANMSPTGYQPNPWMIGAYGEAMRQYSGTGVVNTWSPVDLNLFRGDAWQWDLYANPTGGSTPPAAPAPSAPVQPNNPQPTPSTGGISHTMQWGETIWGLAVAYNAWPLSAWHTPSGDINRYYAGDVVTYGGGSTVTTAPSVDYNALATAVIRGDYGNDPYRRQRLGGNYDKVMAIVNARMSGQAAPSYTAPNASNYGRSYVVRANDTLSGIAARYGISYTLIHGYRSGNPALIYPGEVLHW